MDVPTRQLLHGLIVVVGLVLVVGGLATRNRDVWMVGLIAAAGGFREWWKEGQKGSRPRSSGLRSPGGWRGRG